MPNLYVSEETLKRFAVAEESDSADVWELLAESVSRLFDRECEVSDGFFAPAADSVSLKSYRANGTRYLKLFPYIPNSITIIDVDGTDYYTATVADRKYHEQDNYVIFDREVPVDTKIDVTAKYGFAAVAADIQFACIEQALLMWRRKDLSFADISGVAGAVVNAEFSPSFISTTKRYRDMYTPNLYFS